MAKPGMRRGSRPWNPRSGSITTSKALHQQEQARKRKRGGKKKGISNKQAQYLAALERQLGVPYSGNGLTRAEASAAIDRAKRSLRV